MLFSFYNRSHCVVLCSVVFCRVMWSCVVLDCVGVVLYRTRWLRMNWGGVFGTES